LDSLSTHSIDVDPAVAFSVDPDHIIGYRYGYIRGFGAGSPQPPAHRVHGFIRWILHRILHRLAGFLEIVVASAHKAQDGIGIHDSLAIDRACSIARSRSRAFKVIDLLADPGTIDLAALAEL